MKAGGFSTPGVTAFFDVRVTHVNSRSNQGKSTTTIFREHESEKKRKYNHVAMVTFTPLVFGTDGGMGVDCQNFSRTLSDKISNKNNEPYANVMSYLRMELSFAILRSVHKCARGSKIPLKSGNFTDDFTFCLHIAGVL